MQKSNKQKEKKKKYKTYEEKSTRVDLSRSDCYELAYDVLDEMRHFNGKLKEQLLVERYCPYAEDKREFNLCTVEGIEDDGIIRFWDTVRGQWYYVDLYADDLPYVLRITKALKVKRKQKTEDVIEDISNISDEQEELDDDEKSVSLQDSFENMCDTTVELNVVQEDE